MRYQASYDDVLGETHVQLSSNCYTDAFPLLQTIVFRKQEIDLQSQSLPLACAILTARYCGEVFEFSGAKIGNDYAETIRRIIGPNTNVTSVDGHHRTISSGELDILSERARADQRAEPMQRSRDNTAFTRIDWSGDFVSTDTRNSQHYAFGAYHTNAEFFASGAHVSIAIGLLHGRDRCRNLFVATDKDSSVAELRALGDALRCVSVSLEPLT